MNTRNEESESQRQQHQQQYQYEQPIDPSHDQTPPFPQQGYAGYPQISKHQAEDQYDAGAGGFGAPVMGAPSNPSAHPLNSQAATGEIPRSSAGKDAPIQSAKSFETPAPRDQSFKRSGGSGDRLNQQGNPYVQTGSFSGNAGAGKGLMGTIFEQLSNFGRKVGDLTGKLWSHLMAGSSVKDTAWGRINQGAKVLSEGGIENVFKQTFGTTTDEKLRKSYACFLSTSTGPVVGTLYISTVKFAFCSDIPLQHSPAADQQVSSYYKVVIPLERVKAVNASTNKEKPAEKYIQIVTVDDHEFWLMGFVNYDKGLKNMQEAIQNRASQ
ncbi:hypothetical protein O6H91_19G041300 [Diphasiastrum complanatum]|uniref:Uncharacterized protein n=1 Tax=Diphasiastrum complanatum TaxID=34168 RepID=A0ACC2AUM8_DIPCM|nr:hypothetical protein O6H91_19G041300 [Diphasiastrum complanatum]